jgi:glucose-6-phosphate 1-dehydrogenase
MNPHIFVIFGASGDLTKRKLIPAVYELHKGGFLPDCFAVLGVSRTEYSDEEFREKLFTGNHHVKGKGENQESDSRFARMLFYQSIDTNDPAEYSKVRDRLSELDEECKTQGNYIFYLSTPPNLYEIIPAYLSQNGLNNDSGSWKRLVIEKPFGNDKDSAIALNRKLLEYFHEGQIFRIDHYLGKETVQNMLVTRFANGIFEPLWNRNYISHVEITASEDIGVEKRGGYYDQSGAMRDMVQNHLLQVVAHIAMEPPITADAHAIRNEKLKLFQSIRPIPEAEVPQFVVRGQYISSVFNGEQVIGYREEEGVPAQSRTETYVAMKFFIDNWRWAGVPFYIRTGKRLPTKVTEAVVYFKAPPHHLFMLEKGLGKASNQLIIRIQPDEGLALQFGMKVPGAGFNVKNVDMDFHYSDLTDAYVPEAYERLLLDVMKGDPTLYARGDSVETAWQFIDPILNAWENNPDIKLYGYPAGSWGPDAAEKLLDPGTAWREPCPMTTEDRDYCEL